MAHILNKLTNVKFEYVKKQLEIDAESHAKQGMYLEHLWRNSDNQSEIFFLFHVDNLNKCKQLVKKIYADVLKENPDAKLPEKIFLEEEKL